VSEDTKRSVRTVLQTAVGLCVLLPTAISSAGVPHTLPWAAGAVAVAGGLSRLMALPGVQKLLPFWLRTDAAVNSDETLQALAASVVPATAPVPAPAPAAPSPAAAEKGSGA